jgi:HEAT repeat protein
MKRFFPLVLSLWAVALTSWPAQGAADGDEDQQIATLQSDHSLAEKDAACARLKWIGTPHCVPALAPLLTSDQLSHSARYALESMPGLEAEAALLEALGKTSGSNQVGIINSLAVRRDAAAVPALGKLLSDPDTNSACAAAMGLGRIGAPQALDALQADWRDSASGAVHEAEIDGLLACANQLLTEGNHSAALKVFQRLYDNGKNEGTRQAAFCGVILASGKDGIPLMAQAIAGNDGASQGAALQMAAKVEGSDATKALADLLPKVNVPVQIALLVCLQRRMDPSALPAVEQMAGSPDADVRLAAINALGDLGDGSAAALLAKMAAEAAGAEKSAARSALLNLRRGEVTPALLEAFTTAPPAVKPELIRALGDRGDTSAVPKLLEWARSQDDAMRSSSLQALALLSGPAQLPDLVQLAVQAADADARSEAADALSSACQRIESRAGHCDVEALTQAVRTGPLEARVALLPVCSGLAEAPVRAALRAALADPEARVREAASRALCDTRDGELLPDLLKVVSSTSDPKLRLLAFRGCDRLLQDESVKLSNDKKIAAMQTLMEHLFDAPAEIPDPSHPPVLTTPVNVRNDTTPEKRLVLSGLAAIPDSKALSLASSMLNDPAVKAEAAQAVIQIAGSIAATQPEEAGEALKKVLSVTADPATQAAAQEVQKKIWKTTGFVTLWQVAGPYEQQGKGYSELFDILFAPETGDAASVHWQDLAVSANPAEPWKMDLLQALGGLQRVAYARTWVNSPKEQKVRLEMGSDDGIKVWLNGQLVHANNVARPLQPGSDKVDVTLNKGWNSLLLKVTQFNQGWGFCIRFAEPGGEPVTGLRASLNPPDAAKR